MTWTAAHDARLGDLLRYEDEAERFADFIPRVSPALPPPRHLEPLVDVWQRTRTGRVLAVIEMPPRHGKRIADDCPVFTPDGWRTHGALRVGDQVFALDGSPTVVTYRSPPGPCDIVMAFSDGSEATTHADHLWSVLDRRAGEIKTVTTAEIAEKPRTRWMLPHHGPLMGPQGMLPRETRGMRRIRSIVGVRPCAPTQGHCLQVAHESHTYLIGRTLIPTHNTTTAIHGFAWRMMLDPTLHFAYLTYAEALALIKSRQVRVKAQEAGARLTTTAVTHWETAEGGSFLATGVGGGITGKGITGVAVIDDPHKDRREAESRIIRDRIWDWFTDTFWSRLEDDASVLIIQTRWHRDDMVGRVLAGFEDPATGDGVKFERIRLPALAERDDLLGRQPGEALWPARWPAEKLHGIRSVMGPYGFSSLYQQNPIMKGHQLFGDHPGRFKLADWKLDGHRVVIVCDPAASERTSADHSVALVMAAQGYGPEMKCWVIDHWRGQVEIPALVKQLRHFQSRYWGVAIAVEAVSGFKAVPQMLAAEDPSLRILPITPLGDKWTRAQPFASAWNEGRVLVPTDVEWAREFMAELTDFSPRASTDDQVDAGSHGFNTLFSSKKPRTRGSRRDRTLPFG